MTVLEWISSISLIIGIVIVLGKWLVILPLKTFIKEQTYPIQPTSNGGRSLPDVAAAVQRIEHRLDEHMQYHAKDN